MENPSQNCRNCGAPLPENAHYCPHCGQKNTTGRIKLWDLLSDSFEAIFNIDSRFFHTIRDIFIPGKLTIEYFKGRHKTYANPFRLFFVLAIVHFATLSVISLNAVRPEIAELVTSQRKAAFRFEFIEELDTIGQKLIDSNFIDQPIVREAYDSLLAKEEERKGNFTLGTGYIYLDSNWTFQFKSVELQWEEVFRLSEDEIIAENDITGGFLAEAQVRQMLRVNKDPTSFFRFVFGQLIWMVLLMIVVLSGILKLLYFRRDKYYVEHLVFSFHYHAFAFLIVSIPMLLYEFFPNNFTGDNLGSFLGIAFVGILIYLYIAMKRVYKQHWFKTFLKYWALNFFYVFIFSLSLVLTFVASAFLF